MLSMPERKQLFDDLNEHHTKRTWMIPLYRVLLLDENPLTLNFVDADVLDDPSSATESASLDRVVAIESSLRNTVVDARSAAWLVQVSEYHFENRQVETAYQLARQSYLMDAYNTRGLTVYIATMVELNLKTELFYLGHELVNSNPKSALSWYAVGCYYWSCKKYETSQKYFLKATKIDKKFAKAWVMLGHVLCALEESEQAISVYRTASRLLPGDHKPLVYMAKELVRTNYLSLALHLLISAMDICATDAFLMNELGVVYQKLGKLDYAKQYFENGVRILFSACDQKSLNENRSDKKSNEGYMESHYELNQFKCPSKDTAMLEVILYNLLLTIFTIKVKNKKISPHSIF
jgi:tetratricopeptide (TPR) repeat protein